MKQLIILVFVVLCVTQSVLARDIEEVYVSTITSSEKTKKIHYSGLVEAMPFFGLNYWGENLTPYFQTNGVCIGTVHGIQIIDNYFLGIGAGLNIVAGVAFVPVYLNFRLNFLKEKSHPFMSTSLGMQFGGIINNRYISGYIEPSFGVWSNIMFGFQFQNGLYLATGLTQHNAISTEKYARRENDVEKIYGIFGVITSVGFKF